MKIQFRWFKDYGEKEYTLQFRSQRKDEHPVYYIWWSDWQDVPYIDMDRFTYEDQADRFVDSVYGHKSDSE